jgi:hypothetical protein
MPRRTAASVLRSTMETVSAPAKCPFRGSFPNPMHSLCTLRVRRYRRLTQHSLLGSLLGLTQAGLAPADHTSFRWRLPPSGLRHRAPSAITAFVAAMTSGGVA